MGAEFGDDVQKDIKVPYIYSIPGLSHSETTKTTSRGCNTDDGERAFRFAVTCADGLAAELFATQTSWHRFGELLIN